MPADRFYLKQLFEKEKNVNLDSEESHHLIRVMRKKEQEIIELVNGMGFLAKAKILKIAKKNATLTILEVISQKPQLPPLTLVQAFPKLAHLEIIIQKGTELGVSSFHLFPSAKSEKKEIRISQMQRLEQICIGALKQCGRLDLPKIHVASSLQELKLPKGHAYFGNPKTNSPFPKGNAPYILFVGPEKGFTEKEHQTCEQLFHAQGVRLHPYTLRVETAAIAAIVLASQ